MLQIRVATARIRWWAAAASPSWAGAWLFGMCVEERVNAAEPVADPTPGQANTRWRSARPEFTSQGVLRKAEDLRGFRLTYHAVKTTRSLREPSRHDRQ